MRNDVRNDPKDFYYPNPLGITLQGYPIYRLGDKRDSNITQILPLDGHSPGILFEVTSWFAPSYVERATSRLNEAR